jgi:thymidylate kinase
MNAEMQFLTYAADIFKDSDFIKKEMTKKFVITDRYILSTMAYQSARGFPEEKAISFFNLFDFPKPDFIILLITTTDESMKRKINEHGKLDRHEKDKELLEIVTENYLRYSKEKYFSKNWIIINTSGKIEETKPKVIKILNSILD